MIMALFITTFVLVVLIFAAFRLKIPMAVGPLVVVYFLHIGYSLFNQYTQPKIEMPHVDAIKEIPDSRMNKEKFLQPMAIPVVPDNPRPLILDSVPMKILTPPDLVEENIKNELKPQNKPTSNLATNATEETLVLKEMLICQGIIKRTPVKPGKRFSNMVDSLYCYTKISNSGGKQELQHVWYYNDREMTRVLYNVKPSFNYRSWSKKTIYPENIGKWRVDVMAQDGKILGSRSFTIDSASSNF